MAELDRQIARRIVDYMEKHIASLGNPRDLGKPLEGLLGEFWRYIPSVRRTMGIESGNTD